MTLQSFINVPIPTYTFLSLVDFLRREGSSRDPVEIINTAIDFWMDNASFKQEDLLPDVFDQEKGYRWKQLFLPHGSLMRMKYKGQFHYAKVEGDTIKYADKDVSPSEFTNTVTGTSRNAWRDLEIKRPNDNAWFVADFLRIHEEKMDTNRIVREDLLSPENLSLDLSNLSPSTLSWCEIVERALSNLEGKAHLSKIYEEVTKICNDIGKPIPEKLKQTVQGTLEVNSSDSDNHKGRRDIFYMIEGKGAGVWGLRNRKQI